MPNNFASFPEFEPPADLFDKVISRIKIEQRLLAIKRRLALFSVVLIGSLMAFIPSLQMARASFIESGFLNFAWLMFSDLKIVAVYWQEFVLSLAEALPALNLAILFAVIFTFLISLKYLTKNFKFIFKAAPLINN